MCTVAWLSVHPHTYLLMCFPTARRSNAPTSTSHRFDNELNRLEVEMGYNKGGEEGGNGPIQTVQARLPPYCVHSRKTSNHPKPVTSLLVYRCKWSSRKARPS